MPDPPLRVVLDGHAITPHRSGIGEYSFQLARAMLARGSDVDMHVYAAGRITGVRTERELGAAVEAVRDGDLYAVRHQWELPRLLRGGRYDVFHSPDFNAPLLLRGTPFVVTVHDIVPIVHPDYLGRSKKVRLLPLYRRSIAAVLRRAAAVITVSRFSREELIAHFGAAAERAHAVHSAPCLARSGEALPSDIRARADERGYLLCISRADPYKGIPILLNAYRRLRKALGEGSPFLIVIGAPDPRYDHPAEARRLGLEDDVHFTGYLTAGAVSAVLARATALVVPSLYEGFGLPLLDAMTHGVPVVSSNRASLPEVAGDAALFFDPEDPDAMHSALIGILSDGKLRAHLIQRGSARAASFTWARTAEETIGIYRNAARGRRDNRASA